jgi:outer membrane protein OmpU
MNKLKKIGLSALAGSLVATSAYAGEMSVGGSAKATYTGKETGTNTGSNFGMNKLLTFTGSGDLDNGHAISVYFGNNGTSQSSASMTYNMGDMGSVTLDNGVGGHGIGSIDDKTPTANEEIWDNIAYGTGHDGYRVGVGNAGALAYNGTFAGVTVSADYVKQGGGSVEDGAVGAGASGTSKSLALTMAVADGFTVGVGKGDAGTGNVEVTSKQETAFVTYAVGGFTFGVQKAEETTSNASNWETIQYGASFNVSDNISLGYGKRTVDIQDTTVDEEGSGFSISYTMGSISVAANLNKADDMKGSAGSDKETTEVAVSFAF